MLQRIDHIGIVVKDTAQVIETLSGAFGFQVSESVTSPQGDFKTTVISVGETKLELIEPVGSTGSIARFLDQRGGGMHHVSFRVDDIDQELTSLEGKGVRLAQGKPATVGSSVVAFVHPSSTAGILVELIQRI
jgi:methylmalonyl-CoA/ethylmalonyl-CoA epimerase